jgi:hypothetical protein
MAVIYLKHPIHGAKIACSDLEAAYDYQHGWEEYDPNKSSQPVVVADVPVVTVEPLVENTLRVRRKRRIETQEGT